jgi:hypothetical protein
MNDDKTQRERRRAYRLDGVAKIDGVREFPVTLYYERRTEIGEECAILNRHDKEKFLALLDCDFQTERSWGKLSACRGAMSHHVARGQ